VGQAMGAGAPVATLLLIAIGLTACGPAPRTRLNPRESAARTVISCSPFTDLSGKRGLTFSSPNGVRLSGFVGGSDPAAKRFTVSKGTFTVDPATMVVTVDVAGTRSIYVAYPVSTDDCVLVSGPAERADLTSSWFTDTAGPPDPREGPDD